MNDNTNKIFVGGLSWQTDSEKLSAYFNEFGEVLDVIVMTNPETGKSRGFGFVSFKDASSVQNVLNRSNHQLDGRNIDPKECNLKNGLKLKKESSYCKIFVGGLPHDIKEETLTEFFNKYGRVTEVVIMYDQEKKKTRGFGFVSFDNEETVNKLVDERFLNLNGKKIEIKKAEPRGPTLRSNSSSMTNISIQSNSHNGYLSTLNPYGMPLTSPHQLHAVTPHMPPPTSMHNQNIETSFQFAYHPNSFNTIPIHQHTHNTRPTVENLTNQPLITGYAPTMQTIPAHQPHSATQMVGGNQQTPAWHLETAPHLAISLNQLGQPQTHFHPSMQPNSPNAGLISNQQSQQPSSLSVQQSIVQSSTNGSNNGNLVQQTASSANISPPNTPSSTTTSNLANNNQLPNTNLSQSQLNTSTNQQPPITPVPIHNLQASAPQNWYPNPHTHIYSSPISHQIANAQTNQPPQVVVPFSQAVTFGYPATGYIPANLVSTPWQQQNPYVYSAYPTVPYQTSSQSEILSSHQSQTASNLPSQQGTYK